MLCIYIYIYAFIYLVEYWGVDWRAPRNGLGGDCGDEERSKRGGDGCHEEQSPGRGDREG